MMVQFGAGGVVIFALCICVPHAVQTGLMFTLRALITGAFQVVYIYTPEVYPTLLRSSGLGMGSSMARVGGMLTPFVAVVLSRQSLTGIQAALSIYGGSSIVAAVCSFFLPIETMGRPLLDALEEDQVDNLGQFLVVNEKVDQAERGMPENILVPEGNKSILDD